jgi:hypothetical protein
MMERETARSNRQMLRHTVATLAYRGGKALRDAPESFADFRCSPPSRTPLEIISHLGDLLEWACAMGEGHQRWPAPTSRPWPDETARFFDWLARFDELLASDRELAVTPEKLFQGPIADALTHVGQLTFLRRTAGSPIRGENYFLADIVDGRVGTDQADPRREFD